MWWYWHPKKHQLKQPAYQPNLLARICYIIVEREVSGKRLMGDYSKTRKRKSEMPGNLESMVTSE